MTTVKVLQSVSHGRFHLHEGETRDDMGQADVNTLKELGFVEDAEPQASKAPKTATDSKPAEDNLDDLVGGEKMADDVQNKMEDAPANKAAPAPKKKH